MLKLNSDNKFRDWLIRAMVTYVLLAITYAIWHELLYKIRCDFFSGKFWLKVLYFEEPQMFYKYLGIVVIAVTTAFFTSQTVFEKYLENNIAKESKQDDLFIKAIEMLNSESFLTRKTGVTLLIYQSKQNPLHTQRCLDFLLDINKNWMAFFVKINGLNNGWSHHSSFTELVQAFDQLNHEESLKKVVSQIFSNQTKKADYEKSFELSKILLQEIPQIFNWISATSYFRSKPIRLNEAYLCGFDFSKLTINENFIFQCSYFNGSNFCHSNLKRLRVDLKTCFTGASFLDANFNDCVFQFTYFNCSDFRHTKFNKTVFNKCYFDGCLIDEVDVKFFVDSKIGGEFYVQQKGFLDFSNKEYSETKVIDYKRLATRLDTHKVTRWSGVNGFTRKIKNTEGIIADEWGY